MITHLQELKNIYNYEKNSLFTFLLTAISAHSQSINEYQAVMIPLRFDFQKSDNQYRMQTISKINLQKAGFSAYYTNEKIPIEITDRCSFLYLDLKKESSLLLTKIVVIFKDCSGNEVYRSETGKSREKDYQLSYSEALNKAFESVYKLNYSYSKKGISPVEEATPKGVVMMQKPVPEIAPIIYDGTTTFDSKSNLLYAQPTSYGFQLIDQEPKVVMKLHKPLVLWFISLHQAVCKAF